MSRPKKSKSLLLNHSNDWLKTVPENVLGLLDEAVNEHWKTIGPDHPLADQFAGLGIGIQEEVERRINKRRQDYA